MNGPLIIAHVMGYYMPGLGYQENCLPFAQAELGHQVHIITGDRFVPHPAYEKLFAPRFGSRYVKSGMSVERDVTVHRLPVRFELKRRNNPWLSGSTKLLACLGADVVHLHGVTPLSSLAVMFSSASRRHALVCDHHLCRFNLDPFTPLKRAYYACFRNLGAEPAKKRVKAWLPINGDAEEVLETVLGINGPNVQISRLGVDPQVFRRDAEVGKAWRIRHGLPLDTPVVVHAGKLEPRKEVAILIEGFAAAFKDSGERLLIAGDGDERYTGTLRALADDLGLGDRAVFLPFQPHHALPALFNAADVGVWPGDGSITIFEALGCGLPVALASDPGLDYIGIRIGAGEFTRGSADQLAALLPALVRRDEARRHQIASVCAETLSWRAIAEETISLYRRVVES